MDKKQEEHLQWLYETELPKLEEKRILDSATSEKIRAFHDAEECKEDKAGGGILMQIGTIALTLFLASFALFMMEDWQNRTLLEKDIVAVAPFAGIAIGLLLYRLIGKKAWTDFAREWAASLLGATLLFGVWLFLTNHDSPLDWLGEKNDSLIAVFCLLPLVFLFRGRVLATILLSAGTAFFPICASAGPDPRLWSGSSFLSCAYYLYLLILTAFLAWSLWKTRKSREYLGMHTVGLAFLFFYLTVFPGTIENFTFEGACVVGTTAAAVMIYLGLLYKRAGFHSIGSPLTHLAIGAWVLLAWLVTFAGQASNIGCHELARLLTASQGIFLGLCLTGFAILVFYTWRKNKDALLTVLPCLLLPISMILATAAQAEDYTFAVLAWLLWAALAGILIAQGVVKRDYARLFTGQLVIFLFITSLLLTNLDTLVFPAIILAMTGIGMLSVNFWIWRSWKRP